MTDKKAIELFRRLGFSEEEAKKMLASKASEYYKDMLEATEVAWNNNEAKMVEDCENILSGRGRKKRF